MISIPDFSSAVTPHLDRQNSLPDWVLDDFRSSGVPDALTQANVFYAEDVEALLELGLSHWARKSRTETTRAKSEAIAGGIWFTYGTTIDGDKGPAIYAKPRKPRKVVGFGSQAKFIKYETRFGDRATPILPIADPRTATQVFKRQGITPLPGETFWQTIQRSQCPIAITEGLKKALSLINQGIPTIALRGVTCWNLPQSRQLHDTIAQFAVPGREWLIAFDQDSKPRTVRAVSAEIRKLGGALEATGGRVTVCVWPQDYGKGIDDALVAQGNPAACAAWLNSVIVTSPTLETWKRDRLKVSLRAALDQRRVMPVLPERISTGRYLPSLPDIEPGTIFCLDAPMGAGKTERIGVDWVRHAIDRNWNVLVLSPANALGQQTAQRWKLPHLHDFDLTCANQERLFRAAINSTHGLVLCPDSLLRVPDWFWNGDRPLLLVFDEANQVAAHIVEGGTLGRRQSKVLDRLGAIMTRAGRDGAIIISEADLLPRTLNWVADLSNCQSVRLFQHKGEIPLFIAEILTGSPAGFATALKAALDQGNRIFLVTSSQHAGKRIDLLVQSWGKTVLRIDSETNESGRFSDFWRDPNAYLNQNGLPDLLILSPSGKSGVSITLPGFNAVWGYFTCLSPSIWLQQLGRYRLPVPRRIFAKSFIPTSGDESLLWEDAIAKKLTQTRTGLPKLLGLDVADLVVASEMGTEAKRLLEIQEACERFYWENSADIGAEKAIARELLADRLKQQGHTVNCAALPTADSAIAREWRKTQEKIWLDDAVEFSSIILEPHHTPDWARKILESPDSTRLMRQVALKVRAREEFPGVSFDNLDECYGAIFKKFGALRRGVLLQARAENLDWSRFEDAEATKQYLSQRILLTYRLPQAHLKALLLREIGLLALLDGRPYSNSDPRAIEVRQRSLYYANEIKYYLGLNIAQRQTPCEICNKLLKRLGLEAQDIAFRAVREGDRKGSREWIYVIPQLFDETRIKLLKAATQRLTGAAAEVLVEPPPEYLALMDTVEKRQRRRKPKVALEIEPEILRDMKILVPGDGAGGVEAQGIAGTAA